MSEWTSVDNNLPDDDTEVMVCREGNGFWWGVITKESNGYFYVRHGDSFKAVYDVTHWMPLPEPPKEKTK